MKKLLSMLLFVVLFSCTLFTNAVAKDANLGDQKSSWYGNRDFLWPLKNVYNISSCFFDKDADVHASGHYALDMKGTGEVVASYDGTVCWIKRIKGKVGYGNSVMLKHEYTTLWGEKKVLYTHYGHLASIDASIDKALKEGKRVSRGQTIGVSGDTGKSYGIHLDYMILTEVNLKDKSFNAKKHSLDPYANFLLELPNNVTRGGSTSCCDKYIKAIKTLYKDYTPHRLYTDRCTAYNANGYIKITTATTIKSFPCSRDTSPSSADVRSAKLGERYKVLGLYKNTAGNYWYQIGGLVNSSNSLTASVTGYVYAGHTLTEMFGWSGYHSEDGRTVSQNFSDRNYCEIDVTVSGVYSLAPKCAPNSRLDAKNGGTKSGTNIQIYESNGTSAQKFRFTKLSNGYYKITCENSGLALDVSGGIAFSGTNVQLYTYNGTDAQLWKISDAGNGYYYIVSKLDPCLVLDVWNKGSKNGTNVHVWENNGSAAQLWKLIK